MFKKYELDKVTDFLEGFKFYLKHEEFKFLVLELVNLTFMSFLSASDFLKTGNFFSIAFFHLNGFVSIELIKSTTGIIKKDYKKENATKLEVVKTEK